MRITRQITDAKTGRAWVEEYDDPDVLTEAEGKQADAAWTAGEAQRYGADQAEWVQIRAMAQGSDPGMSLLAKRLLAQQPEPPPLRPVGLAMEMGWRWDKHAKQWREPKAWTPDGPTTGPPSQSPGQGQGRT